MPEVPRLTDLPNVAADGKAIVVPPCYHLRPPHEPRDLVWVKDEAFAEGGYWTVKAE